MKHQLLLDSSFLFELNNPRSGKHRAAVELMAQNKQLRFIPDVALTEITYLLKVRIGQRAVLNFLDNLDSPNIRLEPIFLPDLKRARAIMAQYNSTDLDFVDCCIVALAER